MGDIKKYLDQDKGRDKIVLMKGKIMKELRNMLDQKAPGPGNVQKYWLKKLCCLQDNLVVYLQYCLDSSVISEWLKKRQTVLMQKDKTKGNNAGNFRPVTYLYLI